MTEELRQKYIKSFNNFDILYIMAYLWNIDNHSYGGPAEFTMMEMHVLDYISKHPECIITNISTFFKLTRSASSKIVTRLEAKGVLKKVPAPGSKKNINMIVTPFGKECLQYHEQSDTDYYGNKLDQLCAKYSEEEIKAFFDILENYVNMIHDE